MVGIWDELLTAQDKAVIQEAGYAKNGAASWESRSLGTRPALLLIDMQRMLVGRNVPILQAISDYRTAMGEIAWQALPFITQLLAAARSANLPVFHTRVIPRHIAPGDPAAQIVTPLAPASGEWVIDKAYSSAFFGTDLLPRLVRFQIDTLIIAGNSTSGCVRATAVDARQHGFHPLIPIECVFDRIAASHKISLLDLWMKYAAVLPLDEVLNYIDMRALL